MTLWLGILCRPDRTVFWSWLCGPTWFESWPGLMNRHSPMGKRALGSKTNLPKYTTLHMTPPTLLETSASSLTNILLSLIKLQLSPKPVPLLPLSFTPNLITAILSTINSQSLNYPVSSKSRTLLLVLSWKLPSPVISLPSYALFTGSASLNASDTSSSHLPTKFSKLPNLYTFITSSPFNILAVLVLHSSLLLLGHLHYSL